MRKHQSNKHLTTTRGCVQDIEIDSTREGQRIDNFLFSYWRKVPKSRLYKALRKGEIRVNKKRVGADYRLQAGDKLRLPPIWEQHKARVAEPSQMLLDHLCEQYLYEDDHLLVINKPAGLAVHAGSGEAFGLIEACQRLYAEDQFLALVHRLDKATSGCILLAKDRHWLAHCHRELRAGLMHKTYLLLAQGSWQGGIRSVDLPLLKNQQMGQERVAVAHEMGKSAQTLFTPLAIIDEQTCLLKAQPVTGRTHQIRVHASAIGHPIVGDNKYGDPHFNQRWRALGIKQLCLHAHQIKLKHPNSERQLMFTAPIDAAWGQWVTGAMSHREK